MRPKHHVSLGVALVAFLGPLSATAATYYVAPTGSDSASGTEAAPFATLQKANTSAAAGDTILLRGGTYYVTSQITLSKSGTSDTNRTKIWAYPGEVPVLDCSRYATTNTAADVPAILVTGSWMHLKGLEIANAKVGASGDHSYSLLRTKGSSNNTFELLNLHHGFGPGLFIDTGTGGNLILNCDSHDNYDANGSQGDGQNGDGFGVHYQTTGPSTIIRGCRAWIDSDDGYDLIYQEVPVIIENSFAIQNGYANGGTTSPSSGNGNGFKVGSSGTGIRHIVQNNVAWKNKAAGFYANHSSGGNTWYNNTSASNGTQFNMLAATFASDGRTIATDGITLTGSRVHIMRNNIGFPNKNANMTGVDTTFNTWDLGITPAAADFASNADTGCTGPRQADGSVPAACNYLKLTAGSRMIDKGTDVGLPFVGSAPDLGAYEYGATTTSTGGTTGTGGAAATGGSTALGGATSVGGTATTGGSKATGGAANAGGAGGTVATTGGSKATGGAANAGGAGGTVATTGGAVASVGGNAIGGAVANVGGSATGGLANIGGNSMGGLSNNNGGGPVANGGAVAGGNAAQGGSTTGTTSTGTATGGAVVGEAGGCSCRVPARPQSRFGFALFGLGLLALTRRRRSR